RRVRRTRLEVRPCRARHPRELRELPLREPTRLAQLSDVAGDAIAEVVRHDTTLASCQCLGIVGRALAAPGYTAPMNTNPDNPLAGAAVLVTGASRGLGEALAHELARRGARAALVARDGRELDRVVAAIR